MENYGKIEGHFLNTELCALCLFDLMPLEVIVQLPTDCEMPVASNQTTFDIWNIDTCNPCS